MFKTTLMHIKENINKKYFLFIMSKTILMHIKTKTKKYKHVQNYTFEHNNKKGKSFQHKNIYLNGDKMFKYKIYVIFTLIITLCTFTFVSAEEPQLLGKTIYLDPGHGGRDPGAIYKDLKESDINLQITKELKQELEQNGAQVYLTRIGDYDISKPTATNHKKSDLGERARLINESDCDIYISIHLNSDPSSTWQGTQIFYTTNNKENQKIAQITQDKFKQTLNSQRKIKQLKNMYMFDRIEKPGILVEAGFISNENDRYLLKQKEHQKKIAQTIKESIIEYFK